ncbi:MerR family transcriptional regulator [Engelhardtia mirabilis]|uniref:HTH-type transcriptional repressor YcgE n=1 Tax=Engelhardtia mirabilis TaxID=2528011 RepID=A0A518BLA6_9BACT|nr:HTH-type transcriptional repressor YcgE [Planctomycetes bacterium Pla133]QDV02074.1 HTH-type transcriptional repressor YcgE [Planctomycetes bacterium Pla86]
MPSAKKTPELLSIGELAQATGISPDTIRVWERRYGVPQPVRLPSGHRRYTPEQLRWLRRVVEAVSLGHRPGAIVRGSDAELQDLLDNRRTRVDKPSDMGAWIDLVRSFDGGTLTATLRESFDRQAPGDFLTQVVAPLDHEVQRRCVDGDLEVRHSHFVKEVLQDVLRGLRISIGVPTGGPRVLVAALDEDMHDLPVQMAALLCAAKGILPRVLGSNTPFDQIRRAATEMHVDGVAVPTAPVQCTSDQDARIESLRDALPDEIALCVGWHDARFTRRPRRGVRIVREVAEFELWLRELL